MTTVPPGSAMALAHRIDPVRAKDVSRDLAGHDGAEIGALLAAAFPPFRPAFGWQVDALDRIQTEGWHGTIGRRELGRRLFVAVGDLEPGEATQTALRRAVWEQKARVALREVLPAVLGGADVDRTSRELSNLAEIALDVALTEADRATERRFGRPLRESGARSTAVVFGMGKLGGRELNAGSDIDLIALYDSDDGRGEVSLHEYWTHVLRRTVQTIEQPTADGFIWRVDLRLRPEGSRGPLVYSYAAAERYYETWGRFWERAAMLRARGIAGDRTLGDSFRREVIVPFVFRRNPDPAVATSMAEMVQRSRAELCHHPERDLKLGEGGIREAEFFVQSLQLIWGGRDPALRAQGTLDALGRLRVKGFVTDREANDIGYAYLLLRRAEHAIQWRSGVQTHLVPASPEERDALARVLGFEDDDEMLQALSEARATVAKLFASILPESPRPPPRHTALLAKIVDPDADFASDVEGLFGDADVADHLVALARRPDDLLGVRTHERFPHLADDVLDALADSSDPEQAARYLRTLYARFVTPTAYTKILAEESRTVARLITVLGASKVVGDALVARPELTDVVFFEYVAPTPELARQTLRDEVEFYESNSPGDLSAEDRLDGLIGAQRRAKSKVLVQVAVADLGGELELRGVTRTLSDLAEEVLVQAVRWQIGPEAHGLAVIGVGKLGGREIGYGSDLDVLFIYDPAACPKGKDPGEYYSRVAQRVIRTVTRPHHLGPGYELDTRLRPSGSQGLLVTSLAAFARYHRVPLEGRRQVAGPQVLSSGAAWERQALLRARAVAGDPDLGKRAVEVAQAAAYEGGAAPAEEVHHLRMRMERELGHERAGRYDIKTGRGGLLDVEFAVQWLQMRHGEVVQVRTPETLEALEVLFELGYISSRNHQTFRAGYRFLRKLEQRIRVLNGTGASRLEEEGPGVAKLARRMGFERRAYASEQGALMASYREVTERIRASYLDVLGVHPIGRNPG